MYLIGLYIVFSIVIFMSMVVVEYGISVYNDYKLRKVIE